VQELGAWTFGNSTYVDALLLVVILVALLVRRERFTRVRETGIGTWRAIHEVRPIPEELRNVAEVRLRTPGAPPGAHCGGGPSPHRPGAGRQQLLGSS